MAIFGQKHPQSDPGAGSTLIAAATELVGNLTLSDNLHVDGRLQGDVVSESGVVVGKQGRIQGTVKARHVVVSGHLEGSVHCARLEIIDGGQLDGDVHVGELVIESGGRFNGSSEIVAAAEDSSRKSTKTKPSAKTPVNSDAVPGTG
ncbi:MAG: polymer-forming cytoskeletal protein [Wenzhouxiangellaceae bacterium]|nr:polymer-forming cytoskeletal protein [Wenzhouxiangellaceae bacterium]